MERPASASWWTAYVLIHALAVLVLARRWTGEFEQTPTVAVLFIVTAAAIGMTALLRQTRGYAIPQESNPGWELALSGALSLPCFLMLLALSTAHASLVGIILTWCLIVAVESSWWTRAMGRWKHNRPSPRPDTSTNSVSDERTDDLHRLHAGESETREESFFDLLPDGVTQRLSRADGTNGRETVDGSLRVAFDPHERQKSVHVAFCPPLSSKPDFHVEQIDGPLAQIEVGQLESFGVRLEVRLEEVDSQKSYIICQFEAHG